MRRDFEVGDKVHLIEPFKGYRCVEVIGFDGVRIIVKTSSGYELTIYEDELEEY